MLNQPPAPSIGFPPLFGVGILKAEAVDDSRFHPLSLHIKILIFVETENHAAQILHFVTLDKYCLCSNMKISSLVKPTLPFPPSCLRASIIIASFALT